MPALHVLGRTQRLRLAVQSCATHQAIAVRFKVESTVHVLVDQKKRAQFTAKDEKDVMLAGERQAVSGMIMSADEATASFRRRMNWFFGLLAAFSLVIITGIALLADAMDAAIIRPVAALILIALAGFLYFIYRRRMKAWNDRIAARVTALDAAGSIIQLDSAGLVLPGRAFAWPALAIDTVEFVQASTDDGRYFVIERLLLTSAAGSLVLDAALMHNGRMLVDNAWRRLRRAGA